MNQVFWSIYIRQIHFKGGLKRLFKLFLFSATQHFMCYNSFHVAEVILINLHTQLLIEGHKGQNLFDIRLKHAWKLHSLTVIVPPCLLWVSPAPWEVWLCMGCLGSILGAGNHSPQLTDGWESSPTCRENCQQTEEFNPILLKPHFHDLSLTSVNFWC